MILHRIRRKGIRLGELFDRAARRHPTNPVILDHDLDIAPELGRRVTVTQLADLVADFASRLWETGIRPADRVVVHKRDGFDIALLACAIARIGAIPVLLSHNLPGCTVLDLVRRLPRPTLITDQTRLGISLPTEIHEHTRRILLTSGSSRPNTIHLASLIGAPRVPAVRISPDKPALLTHTSGSTSLTVHTGRSLRARYRPQANLVFFTSQAEPLAIHGSFVHSRLFTTLPIGLLQGHPLVILADDDPASVREIFVLALPGIVEAPLDTYVRWEELLDDPAEPLANVKYFSSAFDAAHPRTVHRLLSASRRRSAQFVQLYGQSEAGPIAWRRYTKRHGVLA